MTHDDIEALRARLSALEKAVTVFLVGLLPAHRDLYAQEVARMEAALSGQPEQGSAVVQFPSDELRALAKLAVNAPPDTRTVDQWANDMGQVLAQPDGTDASAASADTHNIPLPADGELKGSATERAGMGDEGKD